ncbi:tubby C-terminal domain-like protein [Paenibacillus sedimenti]|uniref:Tubby C-terminal domain-containing protein n=1 Tax=Paenibacillus sedimenti TaxID=2770274 RepID=A0A926KQ74_9BACL|nr:hypothetical protein [Paenibacillus sedimenti]MBD0382037.1 hypothetical protein [Paenibacillus sedimenti]
MYEYKWHNRYSTKPSNIFDENGKMIGCIQRNYSNTLVRIMDIILEGNLFTDYTITDAENKLIVKTHHVRSFVKRRQYLIDYYEGNEHYQIQLIDKKLFDLGEKTSFEYKGNTYQLRKSLFEWAQIALNDQVIAEWKESLKLPIKVHFKLLDKNYENQVLLLIGIFHTYLHAAK